MLNPSLWSGGREDFHLKKNTHQHGAGSDQRVDGLLRELEVRHLPLGVAGTVVLRGKRRHAHAAVVSVDVLRELVVDAEEEPVVGEVLAESAVVERILVVRVRLREPDPVVALGSKLWFFWN